MHGPLLVDTLVVSLFESNCHILHRKDAHEALVIDPGDQAGDILAFLEQAQLTVVAYLLTHGHVDHVSALAALVASRPAPVAMHPRDASWAFSPRAAMPPYYDAPQAPPEIQRVLAEGQTWEDGGMAYRIIALPGHSPGGVGFLFEEDRILVSGDTLFCGSIGRADLPGADPRELAASLRRLLELPDDTRVYSGHGPVTTIGQERKTNPYLQDFAWAE